MQTCVQAIIGSIRRSVSLLWRNRRRIRTVIITCTGMRSGSRRLDTFSWALSVLSAVSACVASFSALRIRSPAGALRTFDKCRVRESATTADNLTVGIFAVAAGREGVAKAVMHPGRQCAWVAFGGANRPPIWNSENCPLLANWRIAERVGSFVQQLMIYALSERLPSSPFPPLFSFPGGGIPLVQLGVLGAFYV